MEVVWEINAHAKYFTPWIPTAQSVGMYNLRAIIGLNFILVIGKTFEIFCIFFTSLSVYSGLVNLIIFFTSLISLWKQIRRSQGILYISVIGNFNREQTEEERENSTTKFLFI
jgi:hypothetical protein